MVGTNLNSRDTEVHVFVSHSSQDNDFGIRLERKLKAEPDIASIWYDADGGLIGGDLWLDRIQKELVERNVFVVILSPKAIESPWVRHEIRAALAHGISSNRVIIPVMHKMTAVPPFLALYQFVDFTSRSHEEAYQDILTGIRLGVTRKTEEASLPLENLGNLPPYDLSELNPPERFVGREADLAWILQRLLAPRPGHSQMANIVAASGMGGIGKTALAGEVLRRLHNSGQFCDGMAVVVCKDLHDPLVVMRRVLSRFAPNRKVPKDISAELLATEVMAQLTGKDALIVLDNVESGWQLEQVISPLRQAGVAVLLTTRDPVPQDTLPPEASRQLELMPLTEAVDLFLNSYAAIRSPIKEQDALQAKRIAQSLGRHTLAVKLAALHAAVTGRELSEYAKDLEKNLFLVDGTTAVTSILESSYASLGQPAQQLFLGMAILSQQEMGKEAVRALGSAAGVDDFETSLRQVTQLGLVDRFTNADMPVNSDRERLRLHPLIVQYARNLVLAERDISRGWVRHPRNMVYTRMAQYYVEYIHRLTPRNQSERDSKLYTAIDPDEAAMEAVLEGGRGLIDDESQLQLIEALSRYWRDRWRIEEALKYMSVGIQAATRLASGMSTREPRRRLAQLKLAYAKILVRAGRRDEAWHELKQNLTMQQAINNKEGEGIVLSRMAELALTEKDKASLDLAERYLNESVPIHRQLNNWYGEAIDLHLLAAVAERRSDWLQAKEWLERALDVYRKHVDVQGEGVMLAELGKNATQRGDIAGALDFYAAGLKALRNANDTVNIAAVALEYGRYLVLNGKKRDGCALIQEAISIRRTRRLPGEAAAIELAAELQCPLPV